MSKALEAALARTGAQNSNTLTHIGVKGMKWGKRKSKKTAAVEAQAAKKKQLSEMSDDELKSKINRLKLEKEYTQLTSPQIAKGNNEIGKLLKEVGKQQAKNFLNKQVEKQLDALISQPRPIKTKQLALTR